MEVIGLEEARSLGLKRYFTGIPCKRGHLSERTVSNKTCVECSNESRRESYADKNSAKQKIKRDYKSCPCCHKVKRRDEFYLRNSQSGFSASRCIDCTKDHRLRYYLENTDQSRLASKKWKIENKERVSEYKKWHAENNRDAYNRYAVDYRKRNKDKVACLSKKWREENPLLSKQHRRNRRARIKGAEGRHTKDDVKRLYESQSGKCSACDVDLEVSGYHVDHIIPISRGGSNWPDNIQLLCPSCNLSKGAKTHEEWMQKLAT